MCPHSAGLGLSVAQAGHWVRGPDSSPTSVYQTWRLFLTCFFACFCPFYYTNWVRVELPIYWNARNIMICPQRSLWVQPCLGSPATHWVQYPPTWSLVVKIQSLVLFWEPVPHGIEATLGSCIAFKITAMAKSLEWRFSLHPSVLKPGEGVCSTPLRDTGRRRAGCAQGTHSTQQSHVPMLLSFPATILTSFQAGNH